MNLPTKLCRNCFSYIGKKTGSCPVCGYLRSKSTEPSVLPRGTGLGGRYVLGGNIGRGGFGITYLAYDTLAGKTVAVKEYFPAALVHRSRGAHVIPNSEKNAEQFNIGAEKFFDGAELVRRFNGNPNIVSIYECFYENNTAYYVMEYLNGITLERYVEKYGTLTSAQTLYIADKLTMALVVLHSGEVLHRDISPDNVMLCRDGRVKLIDFGAARQFLSEESSGYTVIMKTGFSPMEQYLHNNGSDTRTDIYSLGTLLYYGLTGNIPKSPYERMADDSAFRESLAGVDSGLWKIIDKAAAVAPEERYKNAEELRSALSELKISMTAIAVPKDLSIPEPYNTANQNVRSKHVKIRIFAVAAGLLLAAVLFAVNGFHRSAEQKAVEFALDSDYAGDFNIGGKIPVSELKRFGGDVEITLFIEPWEEMPSNDIQGIIPVNSEDRSVLKYLTSAKELWADENGWITVENGSKTISLTLSREGIESLGDGELGFETYNVIITSAALKPSEKQGVIGIDSSYKQRNAPYRVIDSEKGITVTVELGAYPAGSSVTFESQSIPKSAFYEFDGDVKVTVMLEDADGTDELWNVVYVCNSGYCFNVFDDDVLFPAITNGDGNPLISRDDTYGVHLDKSCRRLVFVIPQYVKEKMSGGIFFQCMNLRVTDAQLEDYNGEYGVFI